MENLLQFPGEVVCRGELPLLYLVKITFADVQALCKLLERETCALPTFAYSPPVILDKNDGKIKWLRTKRPLTIEEFKELADKIKENLESGYVEMLLAMNMPCVGGPGE